MFSNENRLRSYCWAVICFRLGGVSRNTSSNIVSKFNSLRSLFSSGVPISAWMSFNNIRSGLSVDKSSLHPSSESEKSTGDMHIWSAKTGDNDRLVGENELVENMGNSSDVIWYGSVLGSAISRLHTLSSFEQMLEFRDFGRLVVRSICNDSSTDIKPLLIVGSSLIDDIVCLCCGFEMHCTDLFFYNNQIFINQKKNLRNFVRVTWSRVNLKSIATQIRAL